MESLSEVFILAAGTAGGLWLSRLPAWWSGLARVDKFRWLATFAALVVLANDLQNATQNKGTAEGTPKERPVPLVEHYIEHHAALDGEF